MIKQESFTPSSKELMRSIVEMAEKENHTKSKMISLLLEYAIKEKTRRRSKKIHS